MKILDSGAFAIGLFLGVVGGFFFFFLLESSLSESSYSNAISAVVGAVLAGAISLFATHMVLSNETERRERAVYVSFQVKLLLLFSEVNQIQSLAREAVPQNLPETDYGRCLAYFATPKTLDGAWLTDVEFALMLKSSPSEKKELLVLARHRTAVLVDRHNLLVAERVKAWERISTKSFSSSASRQLDYDPDRVEAEKEHLEDLDRELDQLLEGAICLSTEFAQLMVTVTKKMQENGIETDLLKVESDHRAHTNPSV